MTTTADRVSINSADYNPFTEGRTSQSDMKSGMVKMAPYTNMPANIAAIAKDIEEKVMNGTIDPFGGKYTTGDLLGMNKYVKGIDSSLPK